MTPEDTRDEGALVASGRLFIVEGVTKKERKKWSQGCEPYNGGTIGTTMDNIGRQNRAWISKSRSPA